MDVRRVGGPARRGSGGGSRGTALIEFALILPLLLILVLFTIDYGRLIQHRLIIANVSREGGSIGSRQTTLDSTLTSMLRASGRPLDLGGPYGKIFVTRIAAGHSAGARSPTIASRLSAGSLAVGSKITAGGLNLGLTQNLYNHLVFNTRYGTSDISDLTVVEVYYKYRPITPLPRFIQGMLLPNGDGMIIGSKAVF